MTDLTRLSLAAIRDGLRSKDFTSKEVTTAYLARMDKHADLNAYIVRNDEAALEAADAADVRLSSGEARALEGMPLGIKDLFCTEGLQTTAGSRILEGFVPPYESTVTSRLKSDGALALGKLNLDEFAMGSSNETSYFGPVKNPWTPAGSDSPLVPGGSSGGSASAVSAMLCAAATGTDTGGSIRQPASFCGIVGVKPTYGRCSRWGIVAFASSLDQAGPMTRTVRDSAIMLSSMAGHDPKDSTSAPAPTPNFEDALSSDVRNLRIGIPMEYRADGMDPALESLWKQGMDWLKSAGCEIVDISLPHTKYALPVYYIIAPAEASSNLARYDGMRYGLREAGETLDEVYSKTRGAGFGTEVKRRLLIGTYVLSAGYYDAYYVKAQKVRRLIREDFLTAFKSVDAILAPTAPNAAFAEGATSDPLTMYLNDIFTVPASLAGLPALSVPAGLSQNALPLGLQLIGRPFDEATILRCGQVIEDASGFDTLDVLTHLGDA